MFDELIGFEPELSAIGDFVPLKKTKAKQVLAAQKKTADWLEECRPRLRAKHSKP